MRLDRTLVVAALAFALSSIPARAEDAPEAYSRHEVYGSFGVLTIQDALATPVIVNIGGNTQADVTRNTIGAIGVGYKYYVTPWWTLGLLGNYQAFTQTQTSGGVVSRTRQDYFTLMARTDFRWVNGSVAQLYSGFALGGTYLDSRDVGGGGQDKKSFISAGQLNLLGLRLGSSVGLFLELGLGSNGIFAGGLSGRF